MLLNLEDQLHEPRKRQEAQDCKKTEKSNEEIARHQLKCPRTEAA